MAANSIASTCLGDGHRILSQTIPNLLAAYSLGRSRRINNLSEGFNHGLSADEYGLSKVPVCSKEDANLTACELANAHTGDAEGSRIVGAVVAI
jgi:hypothetical protein